MRGKIHGKAKEVRDFIVWMAGEEHSRQRGGPG